MIKELRQSFFQTFTACTVWLVFIVTVFYRGSSIQIEYLWNVVGASALFALIFGVFYNALWNHLSLRPIVNIFIASVVNTIGGLTFVYLAFNDMFQFIKPWAVGIFILTIVLHTFAFYFYAKSEAKRDAELLNKSFI